jgi:hypothetical protein
VGVAKAGETDRTEAAGEFAWSTAPTGETGGELLMLFDRDRKCTML